MNFFRYNLVYTFADGFIDEDSILARSYPEAVRYLREKHENIVKIELFSKLTADGSLIAEI